MKHGTPLVPITKHGTPYLQKFHTHSLRNIELLLPLLLNMESPNDIKDPVFVNETHILLLHFRDINTQTLRLSSHRC